MEKLQRDYTRGSAVHDCSHHPDLGKSRHRRIYTPHQLLYAAEWPNYLFYSSLTVTSRGSSSPAVRGSAAATLAVSSADIATAADAAYECLEVFTGIKLTEANALWEEFTSYLFPISIPRYWWLHCPTAACPRLLRQVGCSRELHVSRTLYANAGCRASLK